MTASPADCQRGRARLAAVAALSLAILAGAAVGQSAVAQDLIGAAGQRPLIDVAVDEARVVRLNQPPSSVILGNPLIADAVVEGNGLLILVGKNYGTTNLIALDAAGNELAHIDLAVRTSGANALSLFRGSGRVSYNCSPRCEMELDVGDEESHFEALRAEILGKNALSLGQGGEPQ